MRIIRAFIFSLLILSIHSCQQVDILEPSVAEGRYLLNLGGSIEQQRATRVDDNGFADGDQMGIYIVDYDGEQSGSLESSELRASNLLYTFDANSNSWSSSAKIYWKDSTTPIDIYGYYPGVEHINNPSEYQFEVSYKQHILPLAGGMSNYEAADLLWGKVTKVAPTEDVIVVNYSHRMAGVKVQLVKGSGFTDASWAELEKVVQVDNTIRYAVVNMADGTPVPDGEADKSIMMLPQSGDVFRAIVVPQTVTAGKTLLSITIDGRTYTHRLTADMVYTMGKLHNFTITVNKSEGTGDYQFIVSSGGVTDWESDELSHDYSSNAYVVIHTAEAGTLESTAAGLGLDVSTIENLKLTGNYNERDFDYIRSAMSNSLRRINLERANLVQVRVEYWDDNHGWCEKFVDNYLPNNALADMTFLRQVILPTNLKEIGERALSHCEFTHPLIIPEGVTHLHSFSCECNAEVVLPHTLEYVGSWAFYGGNVRGELVITDNLKYIAGGAFTQARFSGTFYLPQNIEYIGVGAFEDFGDNLVGDIIIPPSIKEIPEAAFASMGFANGTNLYMHDGIERIHNGAFKYTKINNQLQWPANLRIIDENAFAMSSLKGVDLTFPSRIKRIGAGAFQSTLVEGTLYIPNELTVIESGTADYMIGLADIRGVFTRTQIEEVIIGDNVLQVGKMSFEDCERLSKVHIGKNVDYIGKWAFGGCPALTTFVCLAETPPNMHPEAFIAGNDWSQNIYFDKCVLQVPEKSVELYRNTDVWKQFKNITAYKELAFNVPQIVALNKQQVRQGIIRAEGPWEVIECPSWVTVSPSSGEGKAELTVTVAAQPVGSQTREGKIVFSLKDKNYTTYTDVRQVGGDIGEDSVVVLQQATADAAKAIPLFIVGDGYGAEDVASGKYLEDMAMQMEHFFSIEPLKSYRDYFTVSTAYAVSAESGVGGLTKFDSYDGLNPDESVMDYAREYGVGIANNESSATVLVLLNTDIEVRRSTIRENGLSINYLGDSKDVYPFDQRGAVLHQAVGRGFGKLGPETINHLTFIDACGCNFCNMKSEYTKAKSNGWWGNVSMTNKLKSLPWYHLIFHEKYASIVDVYEGACDHSRGAYRSENQSVMGNAFVHYFNTISREILVRRIMECAGEEFVFDDFVAKDVIELPE